MSIEITPDRLRSMFRPERIALVGASNKSAFSQLVFTNLQRFGAGNRVHLVNRRGVETHGRPTVTSCAEIEGPVDLAYMMVPQEGTIEALRDAAAAGVRNAVVLSSGYGEAGETGRAAEAELVAAAEELGLVLLGPNMLGFANFIDGSVVTSIPVPEHEDGKIALLSQSGASSAAMADFAQMSGVDLTYMVTLGNEAMVTAGHALDFLVDDEQTRAIAIFMETIRDPQTFRRAALNAAAKGKAIVVLKAGSSELSARTAAAHTGALVGNDEVIDAVFRELGIVRVDNIEDMLLTAGAAAHTGPIERSGIGVVSISGGACDIVADRAADLGATLPGLDAATEEEIGSFFADYGTVQNPLDVTGAAVIDHSIFTKSIVAMSKDPRVGIISVINSLPWSGGPEEFHGHEISAAIGEGIAQAKVPTLFLNQVIQPTAEVTKQIMHTAGIPFVFSGLKAGVVAMAKIGEWSQRIRELREQSAVTDQPVDVPSATERRGSWSEAQASGLLQRAGVPVVPAKLATTEDEAAVIAAELGELLAIKVVSPQIVHKSDIGGVKLGVEGEAAVREAFRAVVEAGHGVEGAAIEGALLSPMRSPATELLVGVVRDEQFGPMLAVAVGGVFVEVLEDSVLTPLPVTSERAQELLGLLKASAVLDGYRGGVAADHGALGSFIARVGDLALALGEELVSLEINPVRVDGSQVEALDAVVEWKEQL